jgi:alpha-amylase
MKLAALATLFVPGMAFAAWTTTDFPAFTEEGTGRFISQKVVEKGTRPLQLNFDQQCWQPAGGIKLNQMLSMEPCRGTPPQWRVFREGVYPGGRYPLRHANADAFAGGKRDQRRGAADPPVSEVGR